MGASQTASPLNQPLAESGQSFKNPQGWPLLYGFALGFANLHLQLAVEVMGQHDHKQIGLVAEQGPGGDVVHMALRLQFGEDRLLGAATMMEGHDMTSRDRLVGDHDLELIAVVVGNEEVELDGCLGANRCRR